MKLCLLLVAICGCSCACAAPVTLSQDGILLRDGKPLHAIGVNYYDAFVRTLDHPDDTSYRAGFEKLHRMNIPFARLSIAAFWGKGLQLFAEDREGYLLRLDGVVRAAEENNIGLVPSFFWAYWAVPDIVGEPIRAWGRPDSKTRAFMRDFTREVVSRYKDSPALWMWEFGNEFNLSADLPEIERSLAPELPNQGTPAARDIDADLLTTADIANALNAFVQTIRALDTDRPITSGDALPRARAESLRATRGWATLDSREAFQQGLRLQHPEGVNVLSVHIYPEFTREDRFEPGHHADYAELLHACMGLGKPVFLGEFGAFTSQVADIDTDEKALDEFRKLLDAIVASGVPMAAAWNFNGADHTGIKRQPWNFDEETRAEFLKAIAAANHLM